LTKNCTCATGPLPPEARAISGTAVPATSGVDAGGPDSATVGAPPAVTVTVTGRLWVTLPALSVALAVSV